MKWLEILLEYLTLLNHMNGSLRYNNTSVLPNSGAKVIIGRDENFATCHIALKT